MIRTALIGVTGYGSFYLAQLKRLENEKRIKLLAAVVINPEDARDELESIDSNRCAIFNTAADFFAQNHGMIEWCCIPAGIPVHASLAVEALHAACHVLLEKPAASSMADLMAIEEAARQNQKEVFIGFQHLYEQGIWDLKRCMLQGQIGVLKEIKLIGIWPRGYAYYRRNNWAGKKKSGNTWVLDSPANNAFAHYLNLALFLAGNRESSSSGIHEICVETYRAYPIENFDTIALKAQLDAGVQLLALLSHAGKHTVQPRMEIAGSKGTYIITEEALMKKSPGATEQTIITLDMNRMREQMFNSIADFLTGCHSPVCTPGMTKQHTLLINAIEQSACIHRFHPFTLKRKNGQLYLPGLCDVFSLCFSKGKLPSELGVQWAEKAVVFKCSEFPGIMS